MFEGFVIPLFSQQWWVELGLIGWIVSIVVSTVLIIAIAVALGYWAYESAQVEVKPRRPINSRRYRRPMISRAGDFDDDERPENGLLQSWDMVERQLIAEGLIADGSIPQMFSSQADASSNTEIAAHSDGDDIRSGLVRRRARQGGGA